MKKLLELFNGVITSPSNDGSHEIFMEDGIIIPRDAVKHKDVILKFIEEKRLSGDALNKTFYNSWAQIKNSSEEELLINQIAHYLSGYGTNFSEELYIPREKVSIPLDLRFVVIRAFTKEEVIEKCFNLLNSGIALKQETLKDILSVLTDECSYTFTGEENIKNKEAVVLIADMYGVLPKDLMSFFRFIIYRMTNDTLLIKSQEVIFHIGHSSFNPGPMMTKFGEQKLSQIFNRFKPLFLAMKSNCPKTINRISKLSKKHHKPMVINPLNIATSVILKESDTHWLDNATVFALFKLVQALQNRITCESMNFMYNIRNGKSFTKTELTIHLEVCKKNLEFVLDYLKSRLNFEGKTFYIPKGIKYGLPTSEKMFTGNIPMGTIFSAKKLAVGIYWKNEWGANDLDLSMLPIGGKIGWNANHKTESLYFSGDITYAPNGATEYVMATGDITPTLVSNNVYSGAQDCKFNFIVGKGGNINKDYMMNPNNLFYSTSCQSIQRQTMLGLFYSEKGKNHFVVANVGTGSARVSGNSEITQKLRKAIFEKWTNVYTLNKLIKSLGGKIVREIDNNSIDLSPEKLSKDTFLELLNPQS